MIITFKDKSYQLLEVRLVIHLNRWYFYDINQFVNSESEICYGCLCFTLIKTVKEIKDNNSQVGFKKY